MNSLTELGLAEARDALLAKKFSARELADAHVKAVEASRPLNAYIVETPEKARDGGGERSATARGEARPLEGLLLAIKDLFCTEGVQTTAGSKILKAGL